MSRIGLPHHFLIEDRILPLHQLPAALIDLAISLCIDQHALLRGTGIFLEDLADHRKHISCIQFLRLIKNIRALCAAPDLALRYGRRLPYANSSRLLQALGNADNIRDTLEILRDFSRLYFPLVHLHIVSDATRHFVLVDDAIGLGAQRVFVIESFMSSLVALTKHFFASTGYFCFYLETQAPASSSQHQLYLGPLVSFGSPVSVITAPMELSHQQHHSASGFIKRAALQACRAELLQAEGRRGFLQAFRLHLLRAIPRGPVSLSSSAEKFDVSPATLKRKLKLHGTHFQAELDHARKLLALFSLYIKNLTNEETAHKIGISDTANFRRSFKRWTGLLPGNLKQSIFLAPR